MGLRVWCSRCREPACRVCRIFRCRAGITIEILFNLTNSTADLFSLCLSQCLLLLFLRSPWGCFVRLHLNPQHWFHRVCNLPVRSVPICCGLFSDPIFPQLALRFWDGWSSDTCAILVRFGSVRCRYFAWGDTLRFSIHKVSISKKVLLKHPCSCTYLPTYLPACLPTNKQTGRQTDGQTDRPMRRQAGMQAGRQTDTQRQTDIPCSYYVTYHRYNDNSSICDGHSGRNNGDQKSILFMMTWTMTLIMFMFMITFIISSISTTTIITIVLLILTFIVIIIVVIAIVIVIAFIITTITITNTILTIIIVIITTTPPSPLPSPSPS